MYGCFHMATVQVLHFVCSSLVNPNIVYSEMLDDKVIIAGVYIQFCVLTWKLIHSFFLNCSLTALYPSLVSTASIILELQSIMQTYITFVHAAITMPHHSSYYLSTVGVVCTR